MRAIDADALFREMEKAQWYNNADRDEIAEELVLNAPTIEPRKKGKWIDSHTTCSECGWQMIDDVIESPNMVAFNFCPNCGAEMTEGEG